MRGGTLKVTRNYEDAVHVVSNTTGEGAYGDPEVLHRGTAMIKGGKVTAQTRRPKTNYAICVDDFFSCKKSCLKSVKGLMS